MKYLLTLSLLLSCLSVYAQQPQIEEVEIVDESEVAPDIVHSDDMIFDLTDYMAEPEGGMNAFYRFIAQNLRYPLEAQKSNIEGTVFLKFIVEKDGTVKIAESLPERYIGYGLDEEAIRVIKLTKWNPGKINGEPVRVRKVLPIRFKLSGKTKKKERQKNS